MTNIDVVIVNYNSADYLERCLESVYSASADAISVKVYIIDNASRGSLDIIHRRFPKAVLFRNNANVGFARAANYGISRSHSPYILLLNPDTVIEKHFFRPIIDFMEENPEIGICGPRVLESNGNVQGSARAFPTPLTALFGRQSFLTKHLPTNRISSKNILVNHMDQKTPIKVDWVSGACMLVRRAAVEDVGKLDERFFLYWEDADWCRRMIQKDWQIFYFPSVSITHYTGRSSNNEFFRSLLEFHNSSYKLFVKYSKCNNSVVLKFIVFSALISRFYFVLLSNWLGGLTSGKSDTL